MKRAPDTGSSGGYCHIPTSDGATVAIKRKPIPGGPPIIFIHGIAVNAELWDLPEVKGPDFTFRSLASLLHEVGYDLWLMSLRGHGTVTLRSEPPAGQEDWCVDHFIVYDLPAVIDHVRQQTGQRPIVIGASMGSMTLAGYVQGATAVQTGQGEQGLKIVAEPALARTRQEKLAGCVFAEFPAALRWPDALYDASGKLDWRVLLRDWWRHDPDANFPVEVLSRWGWLQALVGAVGEIPLAWLGGRGSGEPWYRRLPAPLAERIEQLEVGALEALMRIAGVFTGQSNHRAEVMLHGRRFIFDTMKAGVLQQMAKCVRQRAFVSALGTPDHVYSDHYALVTAPVLVVQGGRDRIANPDIVRSVFFDGIASDDKEFMFDPDVAHGEIEAAPLACERLYPRIIAWIAAHSPTRRG